MSYSPGDIALHVHRSIVKGLAMVSGQFSIPTVLTNKSPSIRLCSEKITTRNKKEIVLLMVYILVAVKVLRVGSLQFHHHINIKGSTTCVLVFYHISHLSAGMVHILLIPSREVHPSILIRKSCPYASKYFGSSQFPLRVQIYK